MDPSQAASAKEELRQHFRRRRRASLSAAQPGILAACGQAFGPMAGAAPGQRLGLWWPIGAEPDLRPLAAQQPQGLALPAVLPWPAPGVGLRLLYLPWRPGDPLAADACGIPAPLPPRPGEGTPLPPTALAALLVPALAIDRHGVRLGSGGGWYDRLRGDSAWRAVPSLAVLPAACVSGELLPRDPWDVPFDGWIDETGLHRVAAGPDGDKFVASS
jgi:5-formyltetrahydrofolate cyclo-ligase